MMPNYSVDPNLLRKYVPGGAWLKEWNGHVSISLVGFRFLDTDFRSTQSTGSSNARP